MIIKFLLGLQIATFIIMVPIDGAAQVKKRSRINWIDSDNNVLILQNRVYPKARTFGIDLAVGQQNMSRFQDTRVIQIKGNYYHWEDWGLELFYSIIQNSDNSSLQSLRVLTEEIPFMRNITGEMGFHLLYSPFYSKINIWNKIIYFHLVMGIGPSLLETSTNFDEYMDLNAATNPNKNFKQESLIGYNVKIEFKFIITKNILLSPSVVSTFYSTQEAKTGTPKAIKNYQDYLLAIGFSI